MNIKMNTLTLMWIIFIITTTMIYETMQKIILREINNELQNNYTINDYTEMNISTYGYNGDKNESLYDHENNSAFQSDHKVIKIVLITLLFLIVGMWIGFIYVIIKQCMKNRAIRDPIENRPANIYEQFQWKTPLQIRQQRSLSPSSNRRRNRRSSETEVFEEINMSLEKERKSEITSHDIHTEMQHQDRSCQQSQPITFVTHAIIEGESIPKSDS